MKRRLTIALFLVGCAHKTVATHEATAVSTAQVHAEATTTIVATQAVEATKQVTRRRTVTRTTRALPDGGAESVIDILDVESGSSTTAGTQAEATVAKVDATAEVRSAEKSRDVTETRAPWWHWLGAWGAALVVVAMGLVFWRFERNR